MDITDLIGFPSIVILVFRFHMLVVLVFPLRLLAGYLYSHLSVFGFSWRPSSISTGRSLLDTPSLRFPPRWSKSHLYALCFMTHAYHPVLSTHTCVLVLGTVYYIIASFPSAVDTHTCVLVLDPVPSHQRAVPRHFPSTPLAPGIYSRGLHSPIPPEV